MRVARTSLRITVTIRAWLASIAARTGEPIAGNITSSPRRAHQRHDDGQAPGGATPAHIEGGKLLRRLGLHYSR